MQTPPAETLQAYVRQPTDLALDSSLLSRGEWFALFLVALTVAIAVLKWMMLRHIKRIDDLESNAANFQTKEEAEVKYTALAGLLGEIRQEGNQREDRIVNLIEDQRKEAREDHKGVSDQIANQSKRIDALFQQRIGT